MKLMLGIFGPWGCYECGWSEDPRYDSSHGVSPKQREYPNHHVDPCGGATPKMNYPISFLTESEYLIILDALNNAGYKALCKKMWDQKQVFDDIKKLEKELEDERIA